MKIMRPTQIFRIWVLTLVLLTAAGAQAAGPWYVATNGADSVNDGLSWSQPFASISNAVANAGAVVNETIWVSNGTYTITATVTNPTAKACKIRGWSTNSADTILLGPGSNDVSKSFRGIVMSGAGSLLQGLTVTNFYYSNEYYCAGVYCSVGLISNCVIAGNILGYHVGGASITASGAGVYLTSAGLIENCDIIGNKIITGSSYDGGGGGIYVNNGTIRNSRIIGNRSDPKGGGVYLNNATVQDSIIASNYAYQGGGFYAIGGVISNCQVLTNRCISGGGGIEAPAAASSISIMQCNINGNVGSWSVGGIQVKNTVNVLISQCVIVSNYCDKTGVGGLWVGGVCANVLIRNCLVANNLARFESAGWGGYGGAGMNVAATNALIENCTIVSNTLINADIPGKGAGLYATNGVRVVNSIIYHNVGVTTSNVYATAGCTFSNSCTAPLSAVVGTANTDANPRFVAKDTGNFRLNNNSPCINTGMNYEWMTGAVDLEGRKRIRYGTVDMGAYERIHSGTTYGFR